MDTFLGSLVQSCCGEGGTLQTNITGVCGECSQCLGHTGFAPIHDVCAFPVYTAQALGCSGDLSLGPPLPTCTHYGSGSFETAPSGSTGPCDLLFLSLDYESQKGRGDAHKGGDPDSQASKALLAHPPAGSAPTRPSLPLTLTVLTRKVLRTQRPGRLCEATVSRLLFRSMFSKQKIHTHPPSHIHTQYSV